MNDIDKIGAERPTRPDIEVFPGLDAPIDQGQFFPNPGPTLWDKALRVGVIVGLGIVIAFVAMSRGLFVR